MSTRISVPRWNGMERQQSCVPRPGSAAAGSSETCGTSVEAGHVAAARRSYSDQTKGDSFDTSQIEGRRGLMEELIFGVAGRARRRVAGVAVVLAGLTAV